MLGLALLIDLEVRLLHDCLARRDSVGRCLLARNRVAEQSPIVQVGHRFAVFAVSRSPIARAGWDCQSWCG